MTTKIYSVTDTQTKLQIDGTDVVTINKVGGITAGVSASAVTGLVLTQANQPTLPSSGTTLSFTHSLGYLPVSAELEFVCLTAEAGYVAGDVINPANASASYAIPPAIKRTATTVSTTTGVGGWVTSNATTGAFVNLTAANWAWRFKVRTV